MSYNPNYTNYEDNQGENNGPLPSYNPPSDNNPSYNPDIVAATYVSSSQQSPATGYIRATGYVRDTGSSSTK